jgi:hypothetical protein
MNKKKWDVFISHASEDKDTVARPLTTALRKAGVRVWLDEHELTVGDSLSEKIDEGLSQSRFGAVILSPAFFAKHWPKKELTGLRAKEEEGQKVILPIWHNVDKPTVRQFSPILADVLAASTKQGIEDVAEMLLNVIFAPMSDSPSRKNPSVARRFIELLESHPDKITLLDFIRYHLPRTGRYLGWGGALVLEKYELYGVEFDAYAPYIGHGARLTLVSFTEICADPFEIDPEGALRICDEITSAISKIRLIQKRFKDDAQAQTSLISSLAREDYYFGKKGPDYFKSWVPDLWFFLFAGRRSKIDENTARHDAWSRLLKENSDIVIKTYDYILDAFLDRDSDKL